MIYRASHFRTSPEMFQTLQLLNSTSGICEVLKRSLKFSISLSVVGIISTVGRYGAVYFSFYVLDQSVERFDVGNLTLIEWKIFLATCFSHFRETFDLSHPSDLENNKSKLAKREENHLYTACNSQILDDLSKAIKIRTVSLTTNGEFYGNVSLVG